MHAETHNKYRRILGINFFVGRAREAVRIGLDGGLVVAPAAPALVTLPNDSHYRAAVTGADLALTDSGLMVMWWNLTRRDRINRVSGLEYLVLLLREIQKKGDETLFFVMPGQEAAERNLYWLRKQGIHLTAEDCYVAPKYAGSVDDHELLGVLERRLPSQIIIGLGGGTQEKLGLFLRKQLSYKPGIHCIGAALGFLTGDQVRIPLWADRWKLGWFFRCMDKPGNYIPRYWTARKLPWMMMKNRDRLPVGKSR